MKKNIFLTMILLVVLGLTVSAAEMQKKSYLTTSTFAGIEIGSKGVKCSVFTIVKNADADVIASKELFAQSINTTIVSEMGTDGSFSDKGIKETADAVKLIADVIKERYNPEDIVVAAGSSLGKASNTLALADAVKKGTGLDVKIATKEEEIYFSILSAIPPKNYYKSVVVDIGSGTTKIGYLEKLLDMPKIVAIELPYGTVSLKNKAIEMGKEKFADNIKETLDKEVLPLIASESQKKPALVNRKVIYVTGGAAWATANFAKPDQMAKDLVKFNYNDVTTHVTRLTEIQGIYQPETVAKDALDEIDAIKNVFSHEDLIAGALLLNYVVEGFNHKGDEFIFPRQDGWIRGYAIMQAGIADDN